jgi:hypothetical protein
LRSPGFVDDCKQGICHWIETLESSRQHCRFASRKVKNDGIVGFGAAQTTETAGFSEEE